MDRTGMMEDARQELQAQLDRYDHDGVTLVNWLTTQDDQVCPLCASREQTVLTIAEARHILEGTYAASLLRWVPRTRGDDISASSGCDRTDHGGRCLYQPGAGAYRRRSGL